MPYRPEAVVFHVHQTPPSNIIEDFEHLFDDYYEFSYHVHVSKNAGASEIMWRLDEVCRDYFLSDELADYMAKQATIERTYDWRHEC